MQHDLDDPLRLPPAPPAPTRPPLPLATALMPVAGALLLWKLTGSIHVLWFAALGPVMVIASYADGLRGARRTRRRAKKTAAREVAVLDRAVAERHDSEREREWRRTPNVGGYAARPDEIWRAVPGRGDVVVVGSGRAPSAVAVQGEPHGAAAREVRRRARVIEGVPIRVPLTAGIAVTGPPIVAAAVARALLLQVCLAHAPGTVRLGGAAEQALPHAQATRGAVLYGGSGDRPVPPDVDIPIVLVREGAPPPPRCAAVLTLDGSGSARLDHDGASQTVEVEAISQAQARALTRVLAERAATLGQRLDGQVAYADLPAVEDAAASLAAVVGVSAGEPVTLDLVADGPHAVVIGVTGSGKSELLTTWIAGLCRGRSPQQVSLLLVDFKGGRTFDAVADWPHVTGVLTDLDDSQALRAVESLRAEVRHRERVLAEVGARDVGDATGALGRLVIVVDEYAALVGGHPELHELFADIAARGRALGMHLILASQRAAGAFRDAVLANAPLRVAFRVTDAADSRAVLGQDDAALLPGDAGARGTALVRRAADTGAAAVRIARCDTADLAAIAAESAGAEPARAPWLPPLPALVDVAAARRLAGDAAPGIVLGLADEPEQQRRSLVRLGVGAVGFAVVGGAGTGRTTVLRTVAAQAERVVWVGPDPEQAWDAVAALEVAERGTVVLIDDVDALAARLPGEYGAEWLARVERLAREARSRGLGLVLSASRVAGALGRTIDLLPQRALLALPTRADHVAAGGESADFAAGRPPGRGRWGRLLVQFAQAVTGGGAAGAAGAAGPGGASGAAPASDPAPVWRPGAGAAALVLPEGTRADAVRAACARVGARTLSVEEAASASAGDPDAVVLGSPDAWLAQWRLLAEARARAELVVDAACTAEYRALTGRRELPPYALPGAGRAWLHAPDGAVRRVRLPGV